MCDVRLTSPDEWHKQLKYLNQDNHLKTNHPYYHQIQGSMHAVHVEWCDFIVWTPCQMLIQRIPRNPISGQSNLPRLEKFFTEYIMPSEKENLEIDTNDNAFCEYPSTISIPFSFVHYLQVWNSAQV